MNRTVRTTVGQVMVPCHQCGTPLYFYPSQVRSSENKFCDRLCLGKWRSTQVGALAAHWKGGQRTNKRDTRVEIHMPWHPRANDKGYVQRAVIVAELKLRRPLTPDEVVHHDDEVPSNDHPENLIVFANQAEHARYHGRKRSPEQMAAMWEARTAHA